jgi:hypothetical protein
MSNPYRLPDSRIIKPGVFHTFLLARAQVDQETIVGPIHRLSSFITYRLSTLLYVTMVIGRYVHMEGHNAVLKYLNTMIIHIILAK